MPKTAIFTVAINSLDYFEYTLPTIERYAKKVGADFIVLDKKRVDFYNYYFERFYFAELLNIYDRVLYLDADIMVTPNAENIFEKYPDENRLYAYHENDYNEIMDRDSFVEGVMDKEMKWNKINGKYQYFNAGVMLVSSKHKQALSFNTEIEQRFLNKPLCLQTYLNYLVVKNKIPFGNLDYSFNRMFLGKKDEQCERLKADFIHYAGHDTFSDGNKIETIKHDYRKLWQ